MKGKKRTTLASKKHQKYYCMNINFGKRGEPSRRVIETLRERMNGAEVSEFMRRLLVMWQKGTNMRDFEKAYVIQEFFELKKEAARALTKVNEIKQKMSDLGISQEEIQECEINRYIKK